MGAVSTIYAVELPHSPPTENPCTSRASTDSQARRWFFATMCKELSAIQIHLLLLGRKTASERLATFPLELAGRSASGRDVAGRHSVDLPMNRSDVADCLGLRIETVAC